MYVWHIVLFTLTAAICVGVAWWVRKQSTSRAGTMMAALLVLDAAWAASLALQLARDSFEWQVVWFHLWQPIAITIPVLWFVFALEYTGRGHWLTRPVRSVMILSTAALSLLAMSNASHGLFWSDLSWESEPFSHLSMELAFGYYVLVAVLYVYTIGGFLALIHLFVRSRHVTRAQTAALVLGGALPVVLNVASNADVMPVPDLDYTSIGSAAFGIAIAWALFTSRLFAVAPIARDAALDAVADGIVVLDETTTVVDYNVTARTLLPELVSGAGRRLEEICPAVIDEETAEFSTETTVRREGTDRTLSIEESPIERNGTYYGTVLVVRDVTELEAYATELENQTERLSRFASLVSHDLRNPIAIARGYTELAMETEDTSHLENTLVAIDRVDETIDVLLTLAREGDDVVDPDSLLLEDVVMDAWKTTDTGTGSLSVALGGTCVLADRPRLQQLLENLFRNAIDHGAGDGAETHGRTADSPPGHPSGDGDERASTSELDATDAGHRGDRLTVHVGCVDDGFFVEDTGCGIPSNCRESVFEYGYTTDGGGAGLGLVIVDTIASAHGWSVSVMDGESGGARFEIRGVDTPDDG